MYCDTFMDGARKSTRLLWASRGSGGGGAVTTRRQADMEPSTFSRATSALRRGVTICLVRSGPTITSTLLATRLGLRTRRLGLHSRSSGGRGGIRRRTTPRYDDMGDVHRVTVICADTGVVALCQPPCRQERQGVMAWHWDSPVTTCKEDLEVIWVTVISNGHFNKPLGITHMPLRFTDHTVDHNSYRYWGLL